MILHGEFSTVTMTCKQSNLCCSCEVVVVILTKLFSCDSDTAAADTQPVDSPESGITEGKEQDDEGDWEQVGPKNKSSITRMVSINYLRILKCVSRLRNEFHYSKTKFGWR